MSGFKSDQGEGRAGAAAAAASIETASTLSFQPRSTPPSITFTNGETMWIIMEHLHTKAAGHRFSSLHAIAFDEETAKQMMANLVRKNPPQPGHGRAAERAERFLNANPVQEVYDAYRRQKKFKKSGADVPNGLGYQYLVGDGEWYSVYMTQAAGNFESGGAQ